MFCCPCASLPFKAAVELPWQALAGDPDLVHRRADSTGLFAVPAAVVAAAIVVVLNAGATRPVTPTEDLVAAPVWTMPTFSLASAIGIGLPLFIVTMATQNIPGIAVMRSFGYTPAAGRLFSSVGSASILSAPFGAPGHLSCSDHRCHVFQRRQPPKPGPTVLVGGDGGRCSTACLVYSRWPSPGLPYMLIRC